MTNDQKPIEKLTYEQALEELEQIIASLGSDEQPLDQTIALYERGQKLAAHCGGLLEKAELKLKVIDDDHAAADSE